MPPCSLASPTTPSPRTFFFNAAPPTYIYTLSLHDALPILCLIFKLAPSVCRMTFPILASLLVRLVMRHTLGRSEERFSRNAETELVCRLLLEKKKRAIARPPPCEPSPCSWLNPPQASTAPW